MEERIYDSKKTLGFLINEFPNLFEVKISPERVYDEGYCKYKYKVTFERKYPEPRSIEELLGNRDIDQVREEIIELQKNSTHQRDVRSMLYMRYGWSPEEIGLIFHATDTNVPRRYKTLQEYKEKSHKWAAYRRENPNRNAPNDDGTTYPECSLDNNNEVSLFGLKIMEMLPTPKNTKLPSYDEMKRYLDSGRYTRTEVVKAIAEQYHVSARTVRRHIANLGLARNYKTSKSNKK